MPTLPALQPIGIGATPDYPRVSPKQMPGYAIGEGLQELGDLYGKLQAGADKAESTKIVADTKARFNGALQDANDNTVDPTEFSNTASQSLKTLHEEALNSATNPRVKQMVQDSLSNDLIIANTQIKHGTALKTKDKAIDDYKAAGDQLSNAAAEYTGQNRIEAGSMFAQLTANMAHNGFIKDPQEELSKFQRATAEKVGAAYINRGDYDGFAKFTQSEEYKKLTPDTQWHLDNRVDSAIKRQTSMSKDLKKAQIDDAVDAMATRIEKGEAPATVWNDLSQQLKANGLFGVQSRQRFDELVNSFKSKNSDDSPQFNAILDGFEQDRAKFSNGIPDRATVVKWQKEADSADLGIEAKRKLRQDLNNWNTRRAQFEQSAATHAEAQSNRNQAQELKRGEAYLKSTLISPDIQAKIANNTPLTYTEMQSLQQANKEYNAAAIGARARGDASGKYFDEFKTVGDQIQAARGQQKQKTDALKTLSPQAKEALDALNKLKGVK